MTKNEDKKRITEVETSLTRHSTETNDFGAKCKCFLREEKTRLVTVGLSVFIWGIIAHAYGLLNLLLARSSLCELFATEGDILHRVEIGRFMVPVYQMIFHGQVTMPWLNGLLALCWLSVAVWMTTYIFSIRDKTRIVLISGIFTVNITVTALIATYIHDLDADMFAVMLAVCMVFLWYRGGKAGWLGIPVLVMVLGFYQATISVSIALIMFVSIIALLNGEKAARVVRKGLWAIGMILIAGGIYLLAVKLSCYIAGIELSSAYNGLTHLFETKSGVMNNIYMVVLAYKKWLDVFFRASRPAYVMMILHILLAMPAAVAVICAMCKKTLPVINKILILLLGVLLPFGMNISYVIDGGLAHTLMLYAAWLIYLLVILMTDWYFGSCEKAKKLPKLCRAAAVGMLFLILATDVQTANTAYLKKDLERNATLSIMTTVNSEMIETDGYVAGETEVIFVGMPKTGINAMFPDISHIAGLEYESAITSSAVFGFTDAYDSYFRYILQMPLLHSREEVPEDFTDSMAAFPDRGYIQWYDDILVVKLSD